jgi:hypothetical protein
MGSSQNESAFSRGNAMSGAPSISGTAKFARPANAGMMNRKIISVAWTETRPLNVCESTNRSPGCASSARKNIAMSPPIVKNTNVVTRYWIPITLWSVFTRK